MSYAKEFAELVDDASYVAVVAHERPDADSLGSASAFYSLILQLHKKVSFVCKSEIERRFFVIPWVDRIKHSFGGEDLVIVCDSASLERIGLECDAKIVNVDHHATNTMYGELNIVQNDAIATAQVVHALFKEMDAKINAKMATALYAGLLEDSDGFSSARIDGTTFALAKELIELGAKHKDVVKYLQKYSTLSHLRLLGAMLLEMQLLRDATTALFIVEYAMLERYGARYEDAEEALERALELPTVELSLLLLQKKEGDVKVSLRSEKFDCAAIAVKFGGGGHKERAGCELSGGVSLQEATKRILEEVERIEKKEK